MNKAQRERIKTLQEETASLRGLNSRYPVQMHHGEAAQKDHEATLKRVREIMQEITKLRGTKK